jgi:hypothetical protein
MVSKNMREVVKRITELLARRAHRENGLGSPRARE